MKFSKEGRNGKKVGGLLIFSGTKICLIFEHNIG